MSVTPERISTSAERNAGEVLPAVLGKSISPAELVARRIECERTETILLASVITENAIIDSAHADELGTSMREKRGQLTPIVVRARFNEKKEVVYDIIDGFHRVEGKRRNGEETIFATVIYNCLDQELFDLRILAANSVRSVQFSGPVWLNG